ncbi:hypothetical protein ACIBG8_48395 [Nonomuraea sp. NPDC050556]|uniref:hypothetical protein n=1 Tax=Nonomuraea sp. NPDC050556 TaxID=3364369 RepID=UPI0037B4B69D
MTTPEQYAQAVRDALADHPDREELLEDLDDHLAEIAAEPDVPLEERLGPPSAYAEELVAAYGGRPSAGPKPRWRPVEQARSLHAGLLRHAPYRAFTGFLPELRPGWWVLRGYALAMMLLAPLSGAWLVPGGLPDWAVVALFVVVSVWVGRRSYGRRMSAVLVLANVAAAVIVLGGMVEAAGANRHDDPVAYAYPQVNIATVGAVDNEVYNIKPYAKDGTPLTDVYLYDQDGKPITTNPEDYGYKVDRTCGEPVLNRYPLALVEEPQGDVEPSPAATACPTTTPQPVISVSATPEAKATPEVTATPTAKATPTPTKTK